MQKFKNVGPRLGVAATRSIACVCNSDNRDNLIDNNNNIFSPLVGLFTGN